jgi:hypothetical protein
MSAVEAECCGLERDYCLTQGEVLLLEQFTSVRGTIGEWDAAWFTTPVGLRIDSVELTEVELTDYPDVEAVWPEDPAPDDVWRIVVAGTPTESRAARPGIHAFQLRLVHGSTEPVVLRGCVTVLAELTA